LDGRQEGHVNGCGPAKNRLQLLGHIAALAIDAAYCYRWSSMIWRSLVTTVSTAKPTESIVMPFETLTWVGPRNDVCGSRSPSEGEILRTKRAVPGHARTCPAVDILKATQ